MFQFEVLEQCDQDALLQREQHWFNQYVSTLGRDRLYNQCEITECPSRGKDSPLRGRKLSQEHRDKISLSGRGLKRSEETKQKLSEALRGHIIKPETRQRIGDANRGRQNTEEHKAKLRSANIGNEYQAKSFRVMDPNGLVHEGFNLRKFCREHDLKQSSMNDVVKGKSKHHRGWTAASA